MPEMQTSPRNGRNAAVAGQDTSIQLEDMEDENIAIGHQGSKTKGGDVATDDHDDGKKRYSRVKGDDYTTTG